MGRNAFAPATGAVLFACCILLHSVLGLDFGDEHGGEIFYHAAVTPWFRLTGDLQIIRPGDHRRDPALFTGVSAHIKF